VSRAFRTVAAVLLTPLALSSQGITGDVPTIHLAGDSTMAEKLAEKRPETGWGEMLGFHFLPGQVRVANHARNGRSTRTFIEEGRWGDLLRQLNRGDYVFIQFGHNDASLDKPDRYTSPEQYRANLERFVDETLERGAIPVLFTPVVRRRFTAEGEFYHTHGEYPDLVRGVAADRGVPLIDLHRASERAIRELGSAESRAIFLHLTPGENSNYPDGLRDDTHFSPAGARLIARLAAQEIASSGLPLAARLRPDNPRKCPSDLPNTNRREAS
jgi:lysophospholipase L1-like esterase